MDLRERVSDTPRHPWEVARSRAFRRLIREYGLPPDSSSPQRLDAVLDVGSGDSWFAGQLLGDLHAEATIDAWDVNYSAADVATAVDPRIHRMVEAPQRSYRLVIALDVLEHIDADRAFVGETLATLVAPGGLLIASVPAHQRLFTRHDEALGHFRRHSSASLRALLRPSFDIVSEGSLFALLVPPRAVQKLIESVRKPAGTADHVESEWHGGRGITKVVTAVLDADARLGLALADRRGRLPGLSVWAVARRPDSGS